MPIPGTTKLHRVVENNGAVAIELSAADLADIQNATAGIELKGARYSPENEARIDR